MPKNLDFQLTETELLQVTEAIRKDKRPEVRQRATAIRLLALGKKPAKVAESLAVQPVTIYSWFHRFRQDGLEGLANQPKGRPKRKADETYCQALEEAIKHEPGDCGYPFAVWTVERLRDHLEKKTGTHMSVSHLRVVIRKQGYVYRRPKHDLTSLQDPDAKEQARELLEALKKGHSKTTKSGFSLWTKRS
jgi:transposase